MKETQRRVDRHKATPVVLLVLVLLAVLGASRLQGAHAARPLTAHRTFALLADGSLVLANLPGGGIRARLQVLRGTTNGDGRGRQWQFYGHYLALSRSGRAVFALVLDSLGGGHQLVKVSTSSGRLLGRYSLPQHSVFESIVVGPRTGLIYAIGNHTSSATNAVVVAALREDGSIVGTWTERRTHHQNWRVYQGLIDSSERYLLIDYWRGAAIGMDVVKLSGMKLWGCRDLGEAGGQIAGCIRPVYKNAELYRDSVVASSGRAHTLIELTLHGRIEKTFTIWTQGDQHVGDFVIDQRGGIVYQVGSCGYTGGLSEVNIQSTARRALIGVNTELCGERLSLSRDGMIVIGRVTGVIPHAAVLGTLIAVDANSGRVLRRMKVPSEPVDVLVADTG